MEGDYSVLDAIRDITLTDRAFFSIVRFLDGNTRNHIVAAHMRNTSQMTTALRQFMASERQEARRENIVMNIPLGNLTGLLDPSGNFMRNFLDPVPVIPTQEQIRAATENHIMAADTTCAICQDTVPCATRIRACGHCFHSQCIQEWFTMNTRCPVCRHDIRDLRDADATNHNDNRVYTDEE
jgi:hypothetical protein